MFGLNPNNTLLFNIGVNAFACIITAVVYSSYRRDFSETYGNLLLRKMAASLFLVLLSDSLMWLINGKSGSLMRAVNYLDNMVYFLLQFLIVFYWLRYAWFRIYGNILSRSKEIALVRIPFAVVILIILSAPFNGWCFYLDEANYFHRGVLSIPLSSIFLAYLLFVSFSALHQYRREASLDRRSELLNITFFAVPPLAGGLVQTLFYGFSLVWPCTAICQLLILHDKENRTISQDALTGLNNRRNLERYFEKYRENGQNRLVSLFMIDLNDFKKINDRFGHRQGDEALINTAQILRDIFTGTTAFLARYGGDEFVVLLNEPDSHVLQKIEQQIKESFNQFGEANNLPYKLSVSVGHAILTNVQEGRIEDLLADADREMYKDKSLYRRK